MSQNWHNFFYGAFDPAGTLTLDKLPGALWVQALSRTALRLQRLVADPAPGRRGSPHHPGALPRRAPPGRPEAGIAAAVVLALSPAAVTLNRGNIPDTLMILLLVLAADSTVTAMRRGRWISIVMAGVWTALAFDAKMIEAWAILPVLGLAYLVAGRETLWPRLAKIVCPGAVALVISLAYMALVRLRRRRSARTSTAVARRTRSSTWSSPTTAWAGWARHHRTRWPSRHWPRRCSARWRPRRRPSACCAVATDVTSGGCCRPPPSPAWPSWWPDGASGVPTWCAPVAVLFGSWLVVFSVLLSFSKAINAYYTAALAPPVAGLLAIGGVLAWTHRRRPIVLLTVAGTVLVTTGLAVVLVPKSGTGVVHGFRYLVLLVGLVAVGGLVLGRLASGQAGRPRPGLGWGPRRPRLGGLCVGGRRAPPGPRGGQRDGGGQSTRVRSTLRSSRRRARRTTRTTSVRSAHRPGWPRCARSKGPHLGSVRLRPPSWPRPTSTPPANRCCPSAGTPVSSPPRRRPPWPRGWRRGSSMPRSSPHPLPRRPRRTSISTAGQ